MDKRNMAGYSPLGHKRAGQDLATKQQQQHPIGPATPLAKTILSINCFGNLVKNQLTIFVWIFYQTLYPSP